jgi:putative FmdB family regulatory protein
MPLYEYECLACHRHTEKIQKFSDPEITQCPHCGGELKRVITAPAFALKGGGWYADGYASAKPPASGGDAAAPAASGESSASAPAAAPAATGTPAPAAPSSSPAKS